MPSTIVAMSFVRQVTVNDQSTCIGSVSRGSGWSVPCVSIQLTLSQSIEKCSFKMPKQAQISRDIDLQHLKL
jgi:hypothetical protein